MGMTPILADTDNQHENARFFRIFRLFPRFSRLNSEFRCPLHTATLSFEMS